MPLLLILLLFTLLLNLASGSVAIPFSELFEPQWHFIVIQSRLPAALTASLTGAALGATGLLLQCYFRNPLAGPSILGITSGANLMVALFAIGGMQWFGSSFSLATHPAGAVLAAIIGALLVLLLLLTLGRIVRSQITLLIVGMLLSYLASSIITLLGYYASAQGLQQLLVWGMGDFGNVGMQWLPIYLICIGIGLVATLWLIKPLNGWMQGEQYALNLGINLSRTRLLLLLVTGWLAAITTAWCGPISFVGLAMPHVARLLYHTDDHRRLLPATMLLGALCCNLCLWLSTRPDGGTLLPINALTPLFGIPIILYVMLKK